MKKIIKRIVIGIIAAIGLVIIFIGGFIAVLTAAEYRPANIEEVELRYSADNAPQFSDADRPPAVPALARLARNQPFSILSWNIGYASLDESQDFIMDGGRGVRPADSANVRRNLGGIGGFLSGAGCDIALLQEVDAASRRSYYVDQTADLARRLSGTSAFAANFRCIFVPVPFPEFIGRVSSGLLTLNSFETGQALRISLPSPFSWPVRAANLKRCLLVSRMPIAGTGAELVLVNLHLEAYDTSGGREAQTKALLDFLYSEYAKGNYCIAGGDFNQNFPGIDAERFAVKNSAFFVPGTLNPGLLDPGWRFAADTQTPTSRLLNEPYSGRPDETQLYIIDGFIISPNVELIGTRTFDMGFKYSDHHPVKLEVSLQ
ncbi:MAG: endonuclease/exonuclease/phosphatase family protein [Treponema sp.]|jgi:endonuclease/exonuclease/phosphatase family metal-dependent hydrolase|nr:endonuclease/exonuclease/phosphatase family protein [Treponema sp.]